MNHDRLVVVPEVAYDAAHAEDQWRVAAKGVMRVANTHPEQAITLRPLDLALIAHDLIEIGLREAEKRENEAYGLV